MFVNFFANLTNGMPLEISWENLCSRLMTWMIHLEDIYKHCGFDHLLTLKKTPILDCILGRPVVRNWLVLQRSSWKETVLLRHLVALTAVVEMGAFLVVYGPIARKLLHTWKTMIHRFPT